MAVFAVKRSDAHHLVQQSVLLRPGGRRRSRCTADVEALPLVSCQPAPAALAREPLLRALQLLQNIVEPRQTLDDTGVIGPTEGVTAAPGQPVTAALGEG